MGVFHVFEIVQMVLNRATHHICYAVRNIRAGTIFKQKGPSCKKKELHVTLISNIFKRKYENFD